MWGRRLEVPYNACLRGPIYFGPPHQGLVPPFNQRRLIYEGLNWIYICWSAVVVILSSLLIPTCATSQYDITLERLVNHRWSEPESAYPTSNRPGIEQRRGDPDGRGCLSLRITTKLDTRREEERVYEMPGNFDTAKNL